MARSTRKILALASAIAASSIPISRTFAAPPSTDYRLLFADEFNGTSVDTRKWNIASPSWTMPNAASTASASMVSVGNGQLTLSAARNGTSSSFTSGSVSSYQKYTFTGGYSEARILLPDTAGSWPAFWGLYTGWPPEADIMEYPLTTNGGSSGLNNDQYNTAFHYTSGGGNASGAGVVNPSSAGDLRGSYHNFGMDWTAGSSVRFYFDGTQVQSFSNSAVGQMTYMYMILDYAVGGWPGTPSLGQWPAGWTDEMKVDYVRVYQFNSGDPGATWTGASSSSWDNSGNWSTGSVPRFSNQVATFNGAGPSSVSIGSWRVIGGMTFTGSTPYTIGSSSTSLQLASTSGTPLVQAQSTSTVNQTINSKLELWSSSIIRNSMTGGQTLAVNGEVSGSGSLAADGVGTVILAGNNTYSGGTTVTTGTLVMNSPTALGTGGVTLAGGATLIVRTDGGDTATTVNIGNGNTGTIASDVKTGNVGINHTLGNLNISTNTTLNVTAGANATAGSPAITLGTVSMNSGFGAGSSTFNPTTANLTLGAVSSTSSGAKTLVLSGTSSGNAVTGNITNGTSSVLLTKSGTGTWTLTGNNSTYTGATSITGGKLVLNNVGLPSTASVTVSSGATLSVKGSVTTGGTFTSSGSVDLADGTVNIHTVSGGVSLSSSTLNVDLGSATADRIAASGAATVSGTNTVNIAPALGQSMVGGNSYTILTAGSGLSAANFTAGTKPASLGFFSFGLSTPTPTALLVNVTGNATPAVAYWTGAASTALADAANNWGAGPSINTSNWSTDSAGTNDPRQLPGSTTNVVFTAANATGSGGTSTTQLDSAYSVQGLSIDVPAGTGITSTVLSTNGNALTIGSGGVNLASTSNSSATLSGGGPVLLSGNQSWGNNNPSRSLAINTTVSALSGAATLTLNGSGAVTFNGVITNGGGTVGLTNQAGTTILNAVNTYTGATTVSGGTLEISSTARIGGAPVVAGGTLRLNGGADSIADASSIELQAGGTLDIRAASAGAARIETIAALNGAGGTVMRTNSGTTTLTIGSTDASGSFAGAIQNGSGTVALVKIGTGTQTLAGASTYTGGTIINDNGGALLVTHANGLGSGSVTIGNGNTNQDGVLQIAGGIAITSVPTINFESRSLSTDGGSADIENVSGSNSLSANFNINNTGGTSVNILSTAGTLTLSGNMTSTGLSSARGFNFYGGGDGGASGVISNGTAQPTFVQKDGQGTWTLSGNNTYTGGTTINEGTLVLSGNNNFGSAGITASDGTVILSGNNTFSGTTTIDAGTVIMNHPFSLGTGSVSQTGGGANGGGTLVVRTDGGDRAYNLNVGSGSTFTLASDVKTGSVGISHTLGTLAIGSSTTLNVVAGANVASGSPSITLGNVTLSSGVGAGSTTFVPTSASISVAAVTTSTNSAKTLVLDGTASGNAVTGAITNGANVINLVKNNSSTWTLSGSSTFTGGTVINDGTLIASNNSALGSASVDVGPAGNSTTATLALSGNVSVPNAVTFRGRNNNTVGLQNVSGNNTFAGAVTISVGGTVYWVQSDAGTLTLAGTLSAGASGSREVTLRGAGNGVISGAIQNGSGTVAVTKDGTGTWTLSGVNTYTGATSVSAGSLILNNSLTMSPTVNVTGGTLQVGVSGSRILKTNSLTINGSGKADLQNNKLAVVGGNLNTIANWVIAGRNGGTWDGASGIMTSQSQADTGVTGLAVAAATAGRVFGGQTLGAGDVMVMYTYVGDADLNGDIDGDDFAAIDAGYSGSLSGYANGDFNFSGTIDADDYFLIDRNYPRSSPPFLPAPPAGVTSVPEPASVALFVAASLGLRRRRRAC